MPILELAQMTAADVAGLDRRTSCVVITVSPIEEHGPHLPLATDIIEADAVARRLLARVEGEVPGWTFLLYPPIPLGADCFHYPGTASIRPRTLRWLLRDVIRSYAIHGFRHFLLASHHGGPLHNLALDAAARRARWSGVRVLSLAGRLIVSLYLEKGLRTFYEKRGVTPEDRKALDLDIHGGGFETAEMLIFRPELVRDGWQRADPVLVPFERLTRRSSMIEGKRLGYFGAPALASREFGEAYLDFLAERLAPDVVRFLRGERVPGLSLRWRLLIRLLSLATRLREWFQPWEPASLPIRSGE